MSFKYREDPARLSCFKACSSCLRCANKGSRPECNSCSGCIDPNLKRDPYDYSHRCRCSEGIMQYRLKNGKLVQRHFPSNPYGGKVITDTQTQDERDWHSFIDEKRQEYDDPNWDPIRFDDGSSATDWERKFRE